MMAPDTSTDSPIHAPGRSCIIQEADLDRMVTRHEQLACLCDLLEACADRLPIWPTDTQAEQLRLALGAFVEGERESDASITNIFRDGLNDPLAAALMRHVDARHTDDVVHAEDLIAALQAGPAPNGRISAETLGYMLRCFFAAGRLIDGFGGVCGPGARLRSPDGQRRVAAPPQPLPAGELTPYRAAARARSACASFIVTVRLPERASTPAPFSFVSCRLTVSIVIPSTSAI